MRTPAGRPVGALDDLVAAFGIGIDRDLVQLAVTHRSWAYENGGVPTNERLEFLGDAVLGLIVTEWLYREHPDRPEGDLAKLRAAIVNSKALAEVARSIDLGSYLRLGRGEQSTGGRDKSSILADALEALIGAAYLQAGLEAVRVVLLHLFRDVIGNAESLGAGLDWKTSLQELAAVRGAGVPDYLIEESGPDHAKTFRAVVVLAGNPAGEGTGRSKKEAEQRAAEQAWRSLSEPADRAGEAGAAQPAEAAD